MTRLRGKTKGYAACSVSEMLTGVRVSPHRSYAGLHLQNF
jgi:hypothetical protein